jgi:hypothetical protein
MEALAMALLLRGKICIEYGVFNFAELARAAPG